MSWQVQEAKQRFSEVLRAAHDAPQVVTKHGQDVAVVLDIEEYRRLQRGALTFAEFLRAEPLLDDDDLVIERSRSLPREVDLG
ncbi:type II toxin-antitoxin system Phd/YefM family antitoxin [Luteipulveratus mongoliensis]|uniref:Antitoxin n=1 Tax=Luteipulveratus mongoliensis TaxID=571913 RepID=A0A0K1JRR1_9MICO|nr:type II toxin-antitoxin system Phd/YefM family antitoxin [Luteipulveratus mongoliensis]AKU19235.1 prevent-host-death protein [Luteipulveratus mongoliensis]